MVAPSPAPGEARSLGLALVNTELAHRGEEIDMLVDEEAAGAWLEARGLSGPGRGAVTEPELEGLRALRESIRAAFLARIGECRLDAVNLGRLNAAAAGGPRAPQLRWTGGGPEREWAGPRPGSGLEVAIATIAADAIDVVSGSLGESLRACAAHGCVRIFIQDHGRRQWCSRTCGDRVRFARHYEKTRLERG